jgi:pimeloyl-ACP methyl ester carboxylesterase
VEYAAVVDVPALLLYGEQDPWILPPERAALAGALRGPVTVVGFPGQGHGGPYVYAAPARWDAAVRPFSTACEQMPVLADGDGPAR